MKTGDPGSPRLARRKSISVLHGHKLENLSHKLDKRWTCERLLIDFQLVGGGRWGAVSCILGNLDLFPAARGWDQINEILEESGFEAFALMQESSFILLS